MAQSGSCPDAGRPRPLNATDALVFLALLAAAVLGNYCSQPLFFGADFLFGSIFVLLICHVYGVTAGLFSALVAHGYTFFLWGHPYGVLSLALEALFVAVFLKKRQGHLLVLDGLYWVLVGMPLNWIVYTVLLPSGSTTASFVVYKQATNGLFNALVAYLLICYAPLDLLFRRPELRMKLRFRDALFGILATLVLVPTFLLIRLETTQEKDRLDAEVGAHMQESIAEIRRSLSSWYDARLSAVSTLARVAARSPAGRQEQAQAVASDLKESYPDFAGLHVESAQGRTVVFVPAKNRRGESTIGRDFSDRGWFQAAKQKNAPFVSDVFRGNTASFMPLFNIVVPTIREGRWDGCAAGAVDLSRLRSFLLTARSSDEMHLTLLDGANRVIGSTRPELGTGSLLEARRAGAGPQGRPVLVPPPANARLSSMERWKRSKYLHEVRLGPALPWTVVAEFPVAPIQKELYGIYSTTLRIALLFVGASLALAYYLSTRVTRPIAQLAARAESFSLHVDAAGATEWPTTGSHELAMLSDSLQTLLGTLRSNFVTLHSQRDELERGNRALQDEVDSRRQAEEELRRSEERYRNIVENQVEFVDRYLPGGILTYVNAPLARFVGVEAGELLGKSFYPFIHEDDRADAIRRIESLRPEDPVGVLEARVTARDGNVHWLQWTHCALFGEDGTLVEYQGVGRDVTERKRLELEREQLDAQLRHAQKMEAIGTLAGGIAHDFNNILTPVIARAELALMQLDPGSPVREDMDEILLAADRARELVRQILVVSRKEPGRPLAPISLGPLVGEVTKFLRATLPASIEIRTDVDRSCGPVLGDVTQFHQVLLNLCTNAAHAMREGGGTLRVELRRSSERAGSWVKLTVKDTGVGIPADVLPRVFEPYFTTKPAGQGSGMGLAVAHGIVAKVGGEISVASAVGEGTTFEVLLPGTEEVGRVQAPPSGQDSVRGSGQRILVVDDEPAVRGVLARMLGALNYQPVVCSDAGEALDLFRAGPQEFSAVLSDHTMPGMTGLALAADLLELRPDLPVLLGTGYAEGVDEASVRRLGLRGLLVKPYSLGALGEALRGALPDA